MNKLTAKQEGVVNDVISGIKQTQAYKNYYNCSRMKEKTIIEKASKLMAQDNVRARYNELLKVAEEKALMTRERFEKTLVRALEMAIGDEPTPIAVKQRTPYRDAEIGIVQGCFEESIVEDSGKNADLKAVASIAGQIMKFKGWESETKIKHSGNIGTKEYADMTDEEIEKLALEKGIKIKEGE